MTHGRRPSICHIGYVHTDGHRVHVGGWGLSSCASRCDCHRHPDTGQLTLAEDQDTGTLGLTSRRPGCDCCQPWTADELAAIVRDLTAVAALATQ